MNGRVLVAVNDSAASFAAADHAITHARRTGARLRAVAVVEGTDAAGRVDAGSPWARGRELACDAALAHVSRRAADAGIEADTVLRHGRIAAEILAEAVDWGADVIVLGRMERPGHVIPAIGSHTLSVVEFAHVPVLVVPPDPATAA